jgi:DNA invertase Pin-like site-specific DNA recombinase
MAIYIYARVSTEKQTVESQLNPIIARFPDAQIIQDVMSGAKDRPILNALIERLKTGDTLVVAALDRLGRKASKLLALIDSLNARNIKLISCREGVDFSTPVGKMVAGCLASVAELEREIIRERIKAGIARERAATGKQWGRRKGSIINNKKPLGRPKNHSKHTPEEIRSYREKGLTLREINKLTNISLGLLSKLAKESA